MKGIAGEMWLSVGEKVAHGDAEMRSLTVVDFLAEVDELHECVLPGC
jgi:hypothetical protein